MEDDCLLWEAEAVPLSAEERQFLDEFHQLKCDLEGRIRQLRALADHLDSTHKTFTKSNMVVNSIAAASGVMRILGLALPGVTLGGSLVLSAASKGLQAATGVTSILTSIFEHLHSKKVQAQTSSIKVVVGTVASMVVSVGKAALEYRHSMKEAEKSMQAFKRLRAHPHLAEATKQLLTTGQLPARRSQQVQQGLEGTALVMAKRARVLGIAKASLFFGADLAALLSDWKQLKEGAGTEKAKELRAHAQELELLLAAITELCGYLQQQECLQEDSLVDSPSEGSVWDQPPSSA
ncbi:apolipoprotein L6-like [Tenrec ecaudatus]|uniref:apolipoprotein L6-like n=1 Tax=Tenrec ecaudatus TaxID=94439 RepID=UPI003F5A2CCD